MLTWGRAGPPRPWPGCSGCSTPARARGSPSSPSTPCPTWSRRPSAAAGRGRPRPLAAFEQLAALSGGSEWQAQLARCHGLLGSGGGGRRPLSRRPCASTRGAPSSTWPGPSWSTGRRCGGPGGAARGPQPSAQRPGDLPRPEPPGHGRVELRATGETARKRDPSTLSQLTPGAPDRQLVGEGGTNREIGAQLFLSRRTIDYHLAQRVRPWVLLAELDRLAPGRPVIAPIRRPAGRRML